jgi:RNA polymerase sigma-70 factor (ECF subfamily)
MAEAPPGVVTAPDETLVVLARAGDRPAREELFHRHFDVSYRVAYRLLGNEQDARDAVQDGFLKAVVHLGDFDGRSEFRTWLLRIVHNAALDSGRRRRRRPALRLADVEGDEAEAAVPDDPALGLRRDDLRRALQAALDRLSPTIRTTFVLFAEAGLKYEEIAACQDIPLGTVMSRLHNARQKLQSYLEGIDGL